MNENCYIGDSNIRDKIGFLPYNFIITALSILGIIVNLYFIIEYFMKKKKRISISSVDKLYLLLSIFEILISIFWLINSTLFKDMKDMHDKCNTCVIISHFGIFFYMMDWLILTSLVIQIKFIVIDPFSRIQKSNKIIFFYLIISFIFSSIMCLISSFLRLNGISPMITCLIDVAHIKEKQDFLQNLFFAFFIIIPLLTFIYSFYQFIFIINDSSFKYEKDIKIFVLRHLIYLIVYFIFAILLFILYFLDYFHNISATENDNSLLRVFATLITILSCSTPIIIGLVRSFGKNIINKLTINIDESYLLDNDTIEKKRISFFISKIYTSVCIAIEKSFAYENEEIILNEEFNNEENSYIISKHLIMKKNYLLNNDKFISESENFQIYFTEYAPKLFYLLRKLDKINNMEMRNSLSPEKNIDSIKESEGRSGNFFLNTYDKRYIIKTINEKEVETIKDKFLYNLYNHFEENPNSYIGRIYGLYEITIFTGFFNLTNKIHFILMKNVYGIFDDKVLCIYDLKGSKLNRKVEYSLMESNNVMKDVNFEEIERYLFITQDDQKKIFEIGKKDSIFFKNLGIMDYSLLIVKIRISRNEMKLIFGEEHEKNMLIEFDKFCEEKKKNIEETTFIENTVNGTFSLEQFNVSDLNNLRKYIFPSLNSDCMYIISIIDFFQKYDIGKKLETGFKKFQANSIEISSMDPKSYSKRFINNLKVICKTENLFDGGKWEIVENSFEN